MLAKFEDINDMLVVLRDQPVLLDRDVAAIYGVETKRVNEAVRNNLDKFPKGYIFQLEHKELADLKSKISTSNWGGTRKLPFAFTEKGLYMLATILKRKNNEGLFVFGSHNLCRDASMLCKTIRDNG